MIYLDYIVLWPIKNADRRSLNNNSTINHPAIGLNLNSLRKNRNMLTINVINCIQVFVNSS